MDQKAKDKKVQDEYRRSLRAEVWEDFQYFRDLIDASASEIEDDGPFKDQAAATLALATSLKDATVPLLSLYDIADPDGTLLDPDPDAICNPRGDN